jgi:hypothetical protein
MTIWYVFCTLERVLSVKNVSNFTIMKKINFFMIVQWVIFMPLILPLGIITGALEGVKKTFNQASTDIFEKQEASA